MRRFVASGRYSSPPSLQRSLRINFGALRISRTVAFGEGVSKSLVCGVGFSHSCEPLSMSSFERKGYWTQRLARKVVTPEGGGGGT
nr:hypothetical protein CFP56_22127 [Quercus suber]